MHADGAMYAVKYYVDVHVALSFAQYKLHH